MAQYADYDEFRDVHTNTCTRCQLTIEQRSRATVEQLMGIHMQMSHPMGRVVPTGLLSPEEMIARTNSPTVNVCRICKMEFATHFNDVCCDCFMIVPDELKAAGAVARGCLHRPSDRERFRSAR